MIESIGEIVPRVLEKHGIASISFARIYFDGSCEPTNPGGVATAGWFIEDDKSLIAEGSEFICEGDGATNNVAEWCALGKSLRWCLDHRGIFTSNCRLDLFGDSQLVVNQLTRKWACNKEHLQKLRERCDSILKELGFSWNAQWIPREQNERADNLSRQAYEKHTGRKFPERNRKWK